MSIASGDTLALVRGYGANTAGTFTSIRAYMKALASENHTDTAQGSEIRFGVTAAAGTTTADSMILTNATRLGLNIMAPTGTFHVVDSGAVAVVYFDQYNNGVAGSTIRVRKGRGTAALPQRAVSGDTLGGVNVTGAYAATDGATTAAFGTFDGRFLFKAAESFTSTGRGTTFHIETSTVGTTTGAQRVQFGPDHSSLWPDTHTMILAATNGLFIGTTSPASQKLTLGASDSLIGHYGGTPVTKPSAYTQTFATADKTHAARTAVALTDNTTGTANTTLEALTSGTVYATDVAAIRNNFADLAAEHNKLIVDLADTAQLLNSVVDDLQALGLVG